MTTARATVIDADPLTVPEAERWLEAAGHEDAERAFAQLRRAVRAHRLASADPSVHEPALAQALVVRIGHGAGEQVADGRWSAARELSEEPRSGRRRRGAALHPQERVAALLGGREQALACEELTLRARADLDGDRLSEAALQLRAALDAALAELPKAAPGAGMSRRLGELRERQPAVAALADAALRDALPADAGATLAFVLERLEAALRARASQQI